jgi:membrane protein DedA with SNARE-associated domain
VLALFTDLVTKQVAQNGYVAIFLLMVLESACIPIPSEVTMLFGGALASAGFAVFGGHQLNFLVVGLVGTLGNLVGSWLAYWVGSVGGRPIVDRFGRYLLIRPHEVDRAHQWFDRRGEAAVFISRLLPVVRTFISLPAGIARMNRGKFTLYTLLGCLPWTFALAGIGYALGQRWTKAENALKPVAWLAFAAIAIGAVVWVARRWTQVRVEYAELDRQRADAPS